MIGDLVILRARLADTLLKIEPYVPSSAWRAVQDNALGIERQLRELRVGVMRVRLVPVGEIFRRMPFVVRDLARESGRRIRVELSGQHTEIDKFVVERMMDPVLHLVRNSVSHGLEPVDERITAGKPPEGTIELRASASGDLVKLEISDDGRGVDAQRVASRARESGLPVPAQLDDAAILDLICSPGFSTRDHSDHASGRGVGMDVVRTTIEDLGGSVRMESRPGAGTTFFIELPLTLAITDAFIAAIGSETFAVPQSGVREVIEVEEAAIRSLEGGDIAVFRGSALPVIRLSATLNIPVEPRPRLHAFVIGAGQGAVGLLVDRIIGQREIVVRAAVDPLIQVDGVAGATDLGDGRAVLILDLQTMARGTRLREIA
jgi:two-component system chemotaxis sensor kinase CheA